MLGDRAIGREKALGVARGLKALHVSFALTGGLMRVLRAIIEIPMLAMLDSRENLSLGRSVAFQFVSDNHTRHVGQALEEFAKEFLRGSLVSSTLHQNIQHVPVLIHCPPQVVALAPDGKHKLVEGPLVPRPRTTATQLVGIRLTKLAAPFTDSFIGDEHASGKEQFLNIAGTQTESEVEPHGVADDFPGKVMVLIGLRG